jgi:ferredoxin
MPSFKSKRYRLTSFNLEKPGLLALLFKRSFTVGISDYFFHFGLYGSVITGVLLEIAYLFPASVSIFSGLGWRISWLHAVTGVLLLVGGSGFLIRHSSNPHFRLAWGRVFYADLIFMLAIAVTGSLQAIVVFGLTPMFALPLPLAWIGSLHVTVIFLWIVGSLLYGGAVRHGLATVAWRLASLENRHALFMAFSNACGRCGRCVEVCPLYDAMNGAEIEAPVVKLRRYFRLIASGSMTASEVKSIAEQTAVCTMCGLCAGVCPFSFNFVDMYKDLLDNANKFSLGTTMEQQFQFHNLSKPVTGRETTGGSAAAHLLLDREGRSD